MALSERPSQRLMLGFVLALLTVGGALTVVLTSQRAGARSVGLLSASFIGEVASRARVATLSYLSAGPRSLDVVRSLAPEDGADLLASAPLEALFRSLLEVNREIEMLNVGQPDGGFMMVKRMPDESLSVKRVRRDGESAHTVWQHEAPGWSREPAYADRREPAGEAYDPRTRPWFRRAVQSGRLSWIEPYVFFSDRMPGIACALPLFDSAGGLRAVVSADIGIAELSRRLQSYRIGDGGQAVILTAEGLLIAYPGFSRDGFISEVPTPSGRRLQLRSVFESADSVLASAFSARPTAATKTAPPFTFEHRGVDYVARLDPFPIGADQSWIVGVLVPTQDFLGPLLREQRLTLAVTVACLILAVALAAFLLRRSSRRELGLLRMRNAEKQEFIEDLEAKNAEIESFTLAVSHDLKSPLVTIGGFLGALDVEVRERGSERARRDIGHIRKAVGHMGHMLSELLELSRVGRPIGALEEIAMGGLAEEAVANLRGPLVDAGVRVEIDSAMPASRGDRHRLLAVYQNLIENAAKFMGEQPAPVIEVGARRESGRVVYFVRDNGRGVAPASQERIFELFSRLSPEVAGTGVGLAAVKRIVELHKGRIWIESEGAGRGSTFCFTLP